MSVEENVSDSFFISLIFQLITIFLLFVQKMFLLKRKLMFYFVVLILPQLGITSYADVLMLGAEKNPQGNYSLLQKYSTSSLQNQDHLSANNITFEIENIIVSVI